MFDNTAHTKAFVHKLQAKDSQAQGDGQPWTPTLTVKGGTSGFYRIKVGK